MTSVHRHARGRLLAACAVGAIVLAGGRARAALPPGNAAQQWNAIAEDTVVSSGAFQNEGLIYMAYVSAAVYDAVVGIDGGFVPFTTAIDAPSGASVDAAVIEAAYRTLLNYFPGRAVTLDALHAEALAAIPNGIAKDDGKAAGLVAAKGIIADRSNDGRQTPIGVTSPFVTRPAGPGVWRLTPPFASPQTPWVGGVRPFILRTADQFQPRKPASLSSRKWVNQFDEIKMFGSAAGSARTPDQTAVARFWTANVIRQYNRLARDVSSARGSGVLETARLIAMVNVIGADAQIAVMNAKYHFLFWRPVTAIDPSAVIDDGFGEVPGRDDGNSATIEESGWRPLVTTPNHPEYPAAHGSLTSAMAEVFEDFLRTNRIDVDVHGFDAGGAVGNLDAVRHFESTDRLRDEIVEARLWAGVHYRRSSEAGVELGRKVAHFDLRHAFTSKD
jgi:vanadium-dependent haloperoxidase-like protein